MALSVKLQVFEGPLDLLLHLIEKNKIDIYNIPIVLVTDQYMAYIRQMQTEDMNVMSPAMRRKRAKKRIRVRSWYRSFWNIKCINICPSS